jgi:molybdenum cofactor cytidylyltransferase
MAEIWGIILAAGESGRMKVQKLLLPFQGKTMIETVIGNAVESEIDHLLVVLGCNREEIFNVIGSLPVSHCYNEHYNQGMLSSVQCGFRSLPGTFDAVLVFQGDQPLIPADAVNAVIRAYRQSGKGIVIPVFQQRRGHPLLIASRYKEEIENLDGSAGLRALAMRFPEDVLEVDVDHPGILKDIDTPEEYLKETGMQPVL